MLLQQVLQRICGRRIGYRIAAAATFYYLQIRFKNRVLCNKYRLHDVIEI